MKKSNTGGEKPLTPIQAETAAAIVVLARRLKAKYPDKEIEQIESHGLILLRSQPVLASTTEPAQ